MRLIFKNVTVVNAEGMEQRDVFVEDGKISGPFEAADRIIDGSGKFLLPGAIDAHVHFREPGASHKETWETGSRAAAMGGVTSVLDMPNTQPPTITVEALQAKRELVKGRSYVNYGFHFGAAGSGNRAEIEAAENIAGIKVYMGSSTGNLLVDQESQWESVFRTAQKKGVPVIVHAENEARILERSRTFAGATDPKVHAEIRDCECAKIAVHDALELREKIGNKLHVAHMSCGQELNLIRQHAHTDLSCEVAPHHLYFSMDDMKDGFLKMNPPLRHEEDLRSLWEGVRDGSVHCIATDHAPHTKEEKSLGLSAPSGVPGVEFSLPLLLNEVSEGMLELTDVVRLMSSEPARIFGIEKRGRIAEGYHADLVLVDMNKTQTITESMVQSKCGWTPYDGYTLKAWPVLTMVNGEVVMEEGRIVSDPCGEELRFLN